MKSGVTEAISNDIAASVIIPNLNGRNYLEKCLTSLFKMTTGFQYEVIVVDNASRDDSVAMVAQQYPQVKILRMERNCHFAKACNEGIKISKGKYIALLNNDTEVDLNWLQELKNTLDQNREIGFCASRVHFYDQRDLIDSVGDCYLITGSAHKVGHRIKQTDKYLEPRLVFGASASSSIYRREMLAEIGLLDEDLLFGQEDVDLSFRAQLAGHKCMYVPTAVVYHKVSATIGYLSKKYVYLSQRNIEFVFLKNMPLLLLIKYLPVHFIYNLGAFLFALKKGRIIVFLKAKLAFLFHLGNVLRKRRTTQKLRKVSNRYIDSILEKQWLALKLKKVLD